MTEFSAGQAVWTSRLKDAYGEAVELEDENGKASVYEIIAEFEVQGRSYAVLQDSEKDGEREILRIVISPDGPPELESIEDDDEWEDISELYDELTFPDDEV
ncbi:Protein of unknown function [Paenibacillus sophorae]|uniref:DUF1292 domain-containing protein n=1 Tax=Paenibacillus sophorae TaxID=1333845 RepID=A0A1H8M7H2_9BACL|nr:DUF1292 domain-containing protein [Paenibacillus sophorae]QWU17703.1 DUF1292 domain-containing protein [Paenibacillus sophorae]SEO13293.1 Protein of unknown function [Paenibacillus sophorae]